MSGVAKLSLILRVPFGVVSCPFRRGQPLKRVMPSATARNVHKQGALSGNTQRLLGSGGNVVGGVIPLDIGNIHYVEVGEHNFVARLGVEHVRLAVEEFKTDHFF